MEVELQVMLVSEGLPQVMSIEQAIVAAGHVVSARCNNSRQLLNALRVSQADVVIVQVRVLSRSMLDVLERIQQDLPHPVLLVAAHSDGASIRQAMCAGVSTCVVGELLSHRLGTIIEVCMMRFQMQQLLKDELKQASEKLADARDIERVKGIVMKRRQLDEEQALDALQIMASGRQQGLGDFARSVLAVADVL